MGKIISVIVLLAVVATVFMSGVEPVKAQTGAAAYYSPSYTYGEWNRIFNLHVGWGNAIQGARPSPNGHWCVHPDYRVGQVLSLTGSNGVTLTCTIGDMVQVHHQSDWRAKWVVELAWPTFVALGLNSNNRVTVHGLEGSAAPAPVSTPTPTPEPVRYFPETGETIGHGFLNYWEQNGGLMIFGYPLTSEIDEDGMTVQYFERAVFEFHPENSSDHRVLLRRLGAIALDNRRE